MFKTIKQNFTTEELSNLAKRFPLPLLFLTISVTLQFYILFNVQQIEKEALNILKTILLCCEAFIAMTAAKIAFESHNWNKTKYFIISFIAISLIAYRIYIQKQGICSSVFFGLGLFLALIVAPFFSRDVEDIWCCNFNTKLIRNISVAIISSLILSSGTAIIFITINYLFGIVLPEKLHLSLGIVYTSVFCGLYFLLTMPKDFNDSSQFNKQFNNVHGTKFISRSILIPLVLIYFIILYLYIIKIIISQQLPKGVLAYMISAFGIIGIITHFLSKPLQEEVNKLQEFFQKYFYHLLLGPVILLFWCIELRIAEYGITEKRFYLLLTALWLGFSCLYMIFSHKKSLINVAKILTILIFITSFGPLRAESISAYSQAQILKNLLEKENIIQNGIIVKPEVQPSIEYKTRVSDIIIYLIRINKVSEIEKILNVRLSIQSDPLLYSFEPITTAQKIAFENLGFEYEGFKKPEPVPVINEIDSASVNLPSADLNDKNNPLIVTNQPQTVQVESIGKDFRRKGILKFDEPIRVSGFDYITRFTLWQVINDLDSKNKKDIFSLNDKKITILIDRGNMVITDNNSFTNSVNLDKLLLELQAANVIEEKANFEINNEKYYIKIYLDFIHNSFGKYNVSGWAFVKVK